MNDKEFEGSRKALEAKRRELRLQGKGMKQLEAKPLSEGEVNTL